MKNINIPNASKIKKESFTRLISPLLLICLCPSFYSNAYPQTSEPPALIKNMPDDLPIYQAGKIYLKIKDNSDIDLSNFPIIRE